MEDWKIDMYADKYNKWMKIEKEIPFFKRHPDQLKYAYNISTHISDLVTMRNDLGRELTSLKNFEQIVERANIIEHERVCEIAWGIAKKGFLEMGYKYLEDHGIPPKKYNLDNARKQHYQFKMEYIKLSFGVWYIYFKAHDAISKIRRFIKYGRKHTRIQTD